MGKGLGLLGVGFGAFEVLWVGVFCRAPNAAELRDIPSIARFLT